eukprot:gene7473-8302_t
MPTKTKDIGKQAVVALPKRSRKVRSHDEQVDTRLAHSVVADLFVSFNGLAVYQMFVTTKLENPTSYHLKQQQKKQLKEYLNTKQRLNPGPALPLDTTNQDSFYFNNIRLNAASPDITDSATASAGSEYDSLIDDFFGTLNTVNEDMFNECNPFPTTLPTNTGLMDLYAPDMSTEQQFDNQMPHQVSASCPATVKQEVPTSPCDTTMFTKDRQKKDNHNMIERRRRYNINDRIRELGALIPRSDSDTKQNKGTILKSSVDYIKRLRKEKERLRYIESQKRGLEESNKKLTLRVQELELILRASGIATELPTPNLESNFKGVSGLQLANILLNTTAGSTEAPSSNLSSPRQSVSSAMEASPQSTDEISQLSSIHSEDMEDD